MAESTKPTSLEVQARPSIRHTKVSEAEKRKILTMVLVDGMTQTAVAEATGHQWRTVSRALNSPEGVEMRKELEEAHRAGARRILNRAAEKAAKSWVKQLELADEGKKAQHLPAMNLLTHIKAVEVAAPNTDNRTQILIKIGSDAPDLEVIDVESE